LYIIDGIVGVLGGAEKQLGEIIRGLVSRKFKITVIQLFDFGMTDKQLGKLINGQKSNWFESITTQSLERIRYPFEIPTFDGIKILTFPLKRIYSYKGFLASKLIKDIITTEKINIVHTFFESSDILGSIVGKVSKVPFIISSRRDTGFSKNSRLLKCYKLLNNFVDLILVNAQAVRDATIQQENIRPDKIKTIYNGIKLEKYNAKVDIEQKRLELGIDPDAPVVGKIANLHPIKGHYYFLRAAVKVLEKFPRTNFILIGEGPLEEKLKQYANDLNISAQIKFLGLREDIPDIISILDISVLSSLTEGCSNAILESMAGGKPVIASNVGGNPELIVDGETGLIVPPRNPNMLADAECNLISDRVAAIKMGERGRDRVERLFSLDKIIAEFEEVYRSVAL
jgi:glycosyltransferase involved in cell wall biosynthesis